jgi:hypothetical protein
MKCGAGWLEYITIHFIHSKRTANCTDKWFTTIDYSPPWARNCLPLNERNGVWTFAVPSLKIDLLSDKFTKRCKSLSILSLIPFRGKSLTFYLPAIIFTVILLDFKNYIYHDLLLLLLFYTFFVCGFYWLYFYCVLCAVYITGLMDVVAELHWTELNRTEWQWLQYCFLYCRSTESDTLLLFSVGKLNYRK